MSKTKQSVTAPARFALYVRCSTDEQTEGEFTTLDAQAAITSRHVLSLGGTVVKTYSDGGKSGTNLTRPGWKAMLADARAGAFDAVCITLMNRLGRGDAAIIAEYLLKEAGVSVACVHEQYADDEAGFVSKSVNRLVDGMYVVQVRKHTTTKMREMFDRGFVCGHIPFGYIKVNVPGMLPARAKDGKVKESPKHAVPQEEDAAVVRQAFALYLETGTAAKVRVYLSAATGRAWTTTETTRLLADERYTGVALFGQWRKEEAHPALIDRQTWEAAGALLARRLSPYPPQQNEFTYYLRGRVFCPHCGCPYTYAGATGGKAKVYYYVCQSVNHNGKTSSCPIRRISATRLHLSVLHDLHHLVTHKTALHKQIAQSGGWGTADEGLKTLRGQLGKQRQLWEMKRKNYENAIGEGRALATLLPALEKAEIELAGVATQLQEVDAQIKSATVYRPTAEGLAAGWGRLFAVWSVLTEEERAEMLGAVVERVDVEDKEKAAVDFVPFGMNSTTALSFVQVGDNWEREGTPSKNFAPLRFEVTVVHPRRNWRTRTV